MYLTCANPAEVFDMVSEVYGLKACFLTKNSRSTRTCISLKPLMQQSLRKNGRMGKNIEFDGH